MDHWKDERYDGPGDVDEFLGNGHTDGRRRTHRKYDRLECVAIDLGNGGLNSQKPKLSRSLGMQLRQSLAVLGRAQVFYFAKGSIEAGCVRKPTLHGHLGNGTFPFNKELAGEADSTLV